MVGLGVTSWAGGKELRDGEREEDRGGAGGGIPGNSPLKDWEARGGVV